MWREGQVEQRRERARKTAHAALKAMREPDDGMIMAALENSLAIMKRDGVDRLMPDDPPTRPAEVTRLAWQAMISAALKD